MNLELSAVFIPDGDRVTVTFRALEGDIPVTAEDVLFTLFLESTDLVGKKTLRSISSLKVTSQYIQSDKTYEVTFLHPLVKMNLFLEAQATIGGLPFTKQVKVGIAENPRESMDLPDNAIWEIDPFEVIPIQGGVDWGDAPNPNIVIAAPEIRDYAKTFNFSLPQISDFSTDVVYSGGGNRLLINSSSNQFELQSLNKAPWEFPAYLFLEKENTNLLPNSFFLNLENSAPQGWQVDTSGVILQQTVNFDHATSSDVKIWSLRLTQNNIVNFSLNETIVGIKNKVAVTSGKIYCFSAYHRCIALTRLTNLPKITFSVNWYAGNTLISESSQDFDSAPLKGLTLLSSRVTAPPGATHANCQFKMQLEYGDDVEWSFLGPQLEEGLFSTSRTLSTRTKDQLTIPEYDPISRKIRFQIIAGFNSNELTAPLVFTSGGLIVSFETNNLIKANLVGYAEVTAPLSFETGDFLDLTIVHQTEQFLTILKEGVMLAQVALPVVTSNIQPLNIEGIGVELLALSIFSRA